jgi:hypothetical protein
VQLRDDLEGPPRRARHGQHPQRHVERREEEGERGVEAHQRGDRGRWFPRPCGDGQREHGQRRRRHREREDDRREHAGERRHREGAGERHAELLQVVREDTDRLGEEEALQPALALARDDAEGADRGAERDEHGGRRVGDGHEAALHGGGS